MPGTPGHRHRWWRGLGGDGLVVGLLGGLLDGPLVAVDAEVSPQVQVGGVLSGGPVVRNATRTG